MGEILFKDSIIAKKFGAFWEVIQAYFNLPAGATAISIYNPPAGKVFIPTYASFGDMAYGKITTTVMKDGEYYLRNITITPALEREYFKHLILTPVKNEGKDTFTNTDVVTRTCDLIIFGLLIPESEYEKFINEIAERENETVKILKEIRDWLIKALKR